MTGKRAVLGLVILTAAGGAIALTIKAMKPPAAPTAIAIHKVAGAQWRPEIGQPLFIAVLGSDARSGPTSGGGGRCDAIHIIAINPAAKAGTILNFPRDSYVDVAGRGSDKINAACAVGGGAGVMVETLKKLTGIPIQYYAITEFTHFRSFIDELGGIDVDVPYEMRDVPYSGANFNKGTQRMDGGQALAFTRNRHDTPKGDFSRTENQGLFILAALQKFRAEATDPHRIFDYLKVVRRHTDISIPIPEMIKLALLAREIDLASLRNVTVDGSTGAAGGASVVFLNPGDTYSRVSDDAIL